MAKRNILKTYSIEIAAITEKASAQINQLEKELDTLSKNKGMNTGLQSQIDSMTESLNGLKGEVKASSEEINKRLEKINTDKMAEQFKQMDESITKSINDVQAKMIELQNSIEFLSNPNNTKGLTTGFSKAFDELETTINGVLTKFTDVSTVMQGILDGSINTSNIQKDFQKVENDTKNLKKYLNELYKFMGERKLSFGNKQALKDESESTLREFRGLINNIINEAESLDDTPVIQNLILKKLGVSTKDLKSYKDGANKVLSTLNEKLGGGSGVEISLTYRITENDEKAINGIVNQIKKNVINKVQEKLDATPIKIPIGYTYDKSIMKGDQDALDKAEGKDVDEVLFKHINLKVKSNTKGLIEEINKEVTRVNSELRKSGNKIEIEAIAKLNPATIAQTSQEIAEEVEDAQFNYVNGGVFKGGKLTIDQIEGLATENTLKDIRNIISQWNSTGIPGTQSKEFQEQVKVEQETQKYYSDFNKRIRTGKHGLLTKSERDYAETKDQLESTILLEDVARDEINKLVRNTKLKKGDKSVLTDSDFYNKSYKVDGVEYATFGDGETLSAWQAKWDAIFENTFATAENYNKNLGRLFDLTEKDENGKTKILEKGQLKLRREAINKRQKSQRETLALLGVEYGKDSKGKYDHNYILDERHTVTSLEDAYAKTKTTVNEIKNMAQQEYDIRMQEINSLKQQREIMLEIHNLEEKSKAGTINIEELDRLEVLRNELSNQVRIISDTEKYDFLISEKSTLENKIRNGKSLSKDEHKRYMEIDGDIESLFVKVDDLSKFTTQQITKTTENGLSPIDKQIQYLEGQVNDFVRKVRSDIGLVFKPVAEESIEKTASDKKKKKTDRAFSRDNIRRYRLDVPITSNEKYEWNKKTISKLSAENGRLGKLIRIDEKTQKRDFSLLTEYERSKFFQNDKIIKALQAQNHLYEEQQGLLDNLHTGYQHLEKDYSSTARILELSGTNEEKHNQIIKAQAKANLDAKQNRQANVTEESFIHDLSDNSLKEVNEVYKNLQSNIESQAGLTSIQIRGLVESQIQEDIDFFKAELKDTEKTILDMEKNPDKYSTYQKRNALNKRNELKTSIAALEEKESYENNQKELENAQNNLSVISTQRDKIIQKLKEENGLTNDHITLLMEVLELNKQIEDEQFELTKLLNKRNEYVVTPNNVADVENLNNSINTQRSYIKSLENSKAKKLLKVDYSDPWLFERLGIRTNNGVPTDVETEIKQLYVKAIESIYSKFKINSDKIIDGNDDDVSDDTIFNKINELLNIYDRNEKLLKDKQNISKKINQGIVQKMPTSSNKVFPYEVTSLIESESSINRKIVENNTYKQRLQEKLKTYLQLSDGDFDSLLNQILEARKLRDSEIDNASKKVKNYTSNDTLTELSSIDADYQNALSNLRNEQAKALGISQEQWLSIIQKETEKAKKYGAIFDAEGYVKENGSTNLYQERVNFYTEEMMKKDANREKFVRNMLKLTEDELALREENRKKHEAQIKVAKESFEIEKTSLKERQKNTSFTDKAYKAQKAEIESTYEQQKAEQELLKEQAQKEKDLLQAEPKRVKNGKISKNDTSINARISRIIENVTNKEEYALSLAMQKESEIIEARNKRIANITTKRSELQAYQDDAEWARISPKLKALERLDGESDLEYNKRSDLANRRQSLILSKQEAINNAEKEHNKLLKEENAELDKINKKKDKLLSSVQVDTSLTKDTISSLTNSYLEKEKTYLALKKESSLVGTTGTDKIYSDEEKKELQTQLENAAKEFKNIKQQFIKEFLSYVANSTADDLDKQSSIIYQNIMNEKMISEQSEAYHLMTKRDAEIAGKDNEISLIENKIQALEKERDTSLQNLEIQKEIRDFEKGMSAKQKNTSFAVDSKLLEIQALEKERSNTQKNTERYEELTQQIAEAKLHLQWFREEAEKVGLTLSETTGRMYLDSTKKDAAITGLTYKGLARKSGEGSSADYKDSMEFSKRLQKERLKEFHYHSQVVDEVKEESKERKRIVEMWRIAGMNDREAELAHEVQKVNAQLKNRKDLTKEQKQALQEQYEQLKKTIELENKAGKINLTFGKGGYIKEKVGYEDFVNNQAQFATNKILQKMMNSPTSSMSDVINSKAPIENYRLATENTLQNIVKILLQGVKVKLVSKKYKIDHSSKRFGGLNPMLNPDADAINPVMGDWYTKDKKTKDKEKKFLKRKDYNKLISKAKTEEEKNKYRTQALQSGGYFALNEKGNIVSLGSGKKRKDNANRTDQNIINATKKYIETQKLAIKTEDIFAETIQKSEKAIQNKSKASEKSNKKAKSKSKGKSFTQKESKETKELKSNLRKIIQSGSATKEEKQDALNKVLENNFLLGYDAKNKQYYVGNSNNKNVSTDITKRYAQEQGLTFDDSKIKTTTAAIEQQTEEIKENTAEREKNNDTPVAVQTPVTENKNPKFYDENGVLKRLSKDERKDFSQEEVLEYAGLLVDYTQKAEELLKAEGLEGLKDKNKFKNKDLLPQLPDIKKRIDSVNFQLLSQGLPSIIPEDVLGDRPNLLKEYKKLEQNSVEETIQGEIKKQKAIDETTEAYSTQGKVFKELEADYNRSLRYKDSKNETTSKKWTDIYEKTSSALTKEGYQLVDGKWQKQEQKAVTDTISSSKDSPTLKKSQEKILGMDFDSMSYKELKSKKSFALKHMDNAAWKTVLPIIEQKIKDIDDEAEKYFKSFANELEFVQDVLRENKIAYEGDFNIKEISRNGNTFYKFENDKTSGRIYKSNEDGKWHVDAVKDVVETRKQVKALKKDLSKLDGYKFDLLESADPDMFYNSKKIAKAKESLIELRNLKPESFIGIKQDEIDSIKDKIKSVIDVATELRGNLRVGETEILGTIDKTSIDTVRQQMVALAKNTSVGTVEIEKFNAKNNELVYTVRTADDMLQTYTISMNKMNGELSKTLVSETEYVSGFRKVISSLGAKFGELIRYTVASVSIYDTFRVFKQGITVVQDMDAAMTELRKVSKDTESALQSFRKESYKIAADIASTGKAIVNSAADWQKLGYTIQEASELAKNSALYSNVGDMEIDVATEHMVSTLKAFNIEVKDSIQIVDKANEVGNNFAITSAGIGEALERSASSLVAAGNDIDQSIALITAGNIVTQDPESVGNAIKVLSLRIRGSKTELEEMGEETDGLAESSSKLRSELKALTGVDIMLNDKEYKSTYQILLEISKVWDSLSDVSQANTLEKLAGKTRASVVAGLLQNGKTMEEVYQTSINSAGSAMEENERYAQSIQGHLDLLTNKWQEMWDSAINSDVINFFIDLGTGALDLVDKIGLIKSAIGAISIGLGAFTSFKNVGINTLVAY